MSTLDLVTLRSVCEREAAASAALFRSLGGWVANTDDPRLQRVVATVAHRSAWHAELWRERFPVVQQMDARNEPTLDGLDGRTDDERRSAAVAALTDSLTRLAELRDAVDDDLDPSTRRVVDLVAADLADCARLLIG